MHNPYQIVKTVRVTEKATALSEKGNTYALRVDRRANKIQIRDAVEKIFKVTVLNVRTVNVHGKRSRSRRTGRWETSPSWKKAYVRLKEGDKIDLGVTS